MTGVAVSISFIPDDCSHYSPLDSHQLISVLPEEQHPKVSKVP